MTASTIDASGALRPTYTYVLTEYRNHDWSIELLAWPQIPGLEPQLAGPMGCFMRSTSARELLVENARSMLSAALRCDRYDFDLRFLSPQGQVLATSTITTGHPPGWRPGDHQAGGQMTTHELFKLDPQLRARLGALRTTR